MAGHLDGSIPDASCRYGFLPRVLIEEGLRLRNSGKVRVYKWDPSARVQEENCVLVWTMKLPEHRLAQN